MKRKRFTRAYFGEPCGTFYSEIDQEPWKILSRGGDGQACCEENRFRRGLSEKARGEISQQTPERAQTRM